MKTITLALPFEETAAVVADVLARRETALVAPIPHGLMALAIARWAELELRDLVSTAPAIVGLGNTHGRRLLQAIGAAARLQETQPPLIALRNRRQAARTLARRFHRNPQPWMLAACWHTQIGCNVCQLQGPAAPCWGAAGCHGYANGCGCADCTAHARILAFKNASAAGAATADTTEGDTVK